MSSRFTDRARRLLVLLACALPLLAHGLEGEPEDVRVPVRDGVVVNWTRAALEVSAGARGHGVDASRRTLEQRARKEVGPGILAGARAVRVTADRTFAELEAEGELSEALRSRVSRWHVTEARYFASGAVELVGELSLQDLLKPWTLSVARPMPLDLPDPTFTGVVIDARGTGAALAFAPAVRDEDGEVLYDGTLWEDTALETVPVIYVRDPAHPAAQRAGEKPLFVRAGRAEGADLVLVGDDAVRFRTGMQGARVLGEGRLVVVVD